MLKRSILFAFVLCTLFLVALAPMNLNQAPENTAKLQATVIVPPVVATVVAPIIPSGSSAPITAMPMSPIIIIGLLVVLGLAVVIGGMALMSRRS